MRGFQMCLKVNYSGVYLVIKCNSRVSSHRGETIICACFEMHLLRIAYDTGIGLQRVAAQRSWWGYRAIRTPPAGSLFPVGVWLQ